MRVTDLIAKDHRTVHDLFLELDAAREPSARRTLLRRIVEELDVHAQAEEEVFYAAVRGVSRRVDDAEAGHEHLRAIVEEIEGLDASSADFILRAMQLKQSVLNHAAEEEGGMFMDAARLGLEELERLGARMQERKAALQTESRSTRKVA